MRHILVVDDEQYIRDDLKGELQNRYLVHTASSVQEALDIVVQYNFFYAIIDLKLDYTSQYGGIKIFNRLKERNPSINALIISGFPLDHVKKELIARVREYYTEELLANYIYKGGEINYIDAISAVIEK